MSSTPASRHGPDANRYLCGLVIVAAKDLRQGSTGSRPRYGEPAAAAVGLRAADRRGAIDLVGSVDATVGGSLASTPNGRWSRDLALGRSHGMMVALVTYADFADVDLAHGQSIAARAAGADMLLYPRAQAGELAGFAAGSMRLVPVGSLDEAIVALESS